MKKASSSFLVLFFAALLVSFQSFAQMSDIVSERVQQTLRRQERLRLSDLLRVSPYEEREMEVLSLTIMAQSYVGQSTLQVLQMGRAIAAPQIIRRQSQVRIVLPARTSLEGIEILAQDELFLESVTAEVLRLRTPVPPTYPTPYPPTYPQPERQPVPNQMISLQVMQDVRMQQEIQLDTLVRQQMGLTLAGAEIQRVIVEAMPLGYGRAASVQVVLNSRLVGEERFLSTTQQRLPLLIQSYEEVRTLGLLVRGDARVQSVSIRVGQVRPQYPQQPQLPRIQRVTVGQEIGSYNVLELSRVLPYESRLIRSITLEARTRNGVRAEVALATPYQVLGTLVVTQTPMRPVIRLFTPTSPRDLRLQSYSQVLIDSLEIEFETGY
ncbi:hypothetical protein ACJVC5_18060 [Peredibacter sp. HCB2-198]|uniref:hypothetical protein n=1 Tax=Peredibacter sp. HCB2-198 TaxID=3383025 RepID=UPI0038B56276